MSKEFSNDTVFWDSAVTFAADKKVFITSGPTTHCAELMNEGARELVYFGEDCAVEGVKTRLDYKERPNSKDLLVDVDGGVPMVQAERLLKKHGALMSGVAREWSDYFNHVCPVVWSEPEELEDGSLVQSLEYGDEASAVIFWVVASHTLPELPKIQRNVEPPSEEAIALQSAQAEIEELRELLKKSDRAKRSAQTRATNLKASLATQSEELDELQEATDSLKKEMKSLKRKVTIAEKAKVAHADLKAEHKQLNDDLETTREALILREGEHAKTTASLKRAERDHADRSAELNVLQTQHNDLKSTLTDTQRELALAADNTERLAVVTKASNESKAAFTLVAEAWSAWLGKGVEGELPPIPSPIPSLAEAWSQQLIAQQPLVKGTLDEHKALIATRAELSALKEDLAQTRKERDDARTEITKLNERLVISDETLTESLSAERALRKAQERELEATQEQLQAQREQVNELYAELDEARRALNARDLEVRAGDPRVLQLEAQLKIQQKQRAARERLMTVHHELQVQLTSALEEEISSRAELERRLEEAEAELRELRVDRDFPRPRHDDRPRRAERPSRKDRPSREERPRKKDRPRREERSPARPRAERLSSLSAQLKSSADDRRGALDQAETQSTAREAAKPKLNPSSKADQKRVKAQAKRLKKKHPVTDDTSRVHSPKSSSRPSPAPRPSLSSEEINEQTERAQMILKDRLKKLSRNRRS